jgi:hypothetical protein
MQIVDLIRKKNPLIHLLSQEIYIKGTERRAQVRQACSLFEKQKEPRTEPHLSLSSGKVEIVAQYFILNKRSGLA